MITILKRFYFGWFGDAFFVMSAHKLAILAGRLTTFYKVDTFGS
jgi:hypothetical protein